MEHMPGNEQALPIAAGAHPPPPSVPPRKPDSDFSDKMRDWLFGGNVVARLGLLILFMGLCFLLKYLAGTYVMPIEYQVAGVAAIALALLGWGWSIRIRRPGISLPVQGTALATLMLTTFAASKTNHLIPGATAIALLAIFVAFTCVLAVLQDAVWLAVFGIVGGFATPVIMSAGEGNHVALFTWCAILNAGIIVIAALKSWRALNVLGFFCTFSLATSWGVMHYSPDDYLTSQAFLVLFLLMYIAVAMFYARRQAPRLTHYVDGTLVFGAPLAAMGLQYGLVVDIPFGMAYSALALGALYLCLAAFVKRRMGEHCRLLGESFMALGVVSTTLAIPYAFDDRWMSAAWALEAAGVTWTGLRQRRALTWGFGLLVQVASWFSFLHAVSGMDEQALAHAHMWIGFAILAGATFFTALQLRAADGQTLQPFNPYTGKAMAELLLPIAASWLLAGAWLEIGVRTQGYVELNLLVASSLATAALLYGVYRHQQWSAAAWLAQAAALLGCGAFIVHTGLGWAYDTGSFIDSAIPAALMLAAGLSIVCDRRHHADPTAPGNGALLAVTAFAWFAVALPALAAWAGGAAGVRLSRETLPFSWSLYLILAAALASIMPPLALRRNWPQLTWLSVPAVLAQLVTGGAALVWLYVFGELPDPALAMAGVTAWPAAGYVLSQWQCTGWMKPGINLNAGVNYVALHLQLVAMPLLMIWPVLHLYLSASTALSAEWLSYIPAWATMAAVAVLLHCAARDAWPLRPYAIWHRRVTLRLAVAGSLVTAISWNFRFDGGMAPLPYVPLLNPLDVTTGFAALLAIAYWRSAAPAVRAIWSARMSLAGFGAAWLWFNLMLMRSVSHYLDVPYTFDAMMVSRVTQAMLSLVWSGTALALMRHATVRGRPRQWGMGAALLAVVVAKLFLLDVHDRTGLPGIVTFIGVGVLTLAIGYLAPLPRSGGNAANTADGAAGGAV
jgi:uncharacterized membrane protein